jgi:uncharacterized protein YndB with AHSA1/START domain
VDEILVRSIALACPVEHAFAVFTDKIDLWWPRGHRRNREASLTLTDAALVEHSPDGSVWIMGEVTARQPPHLLALDWFPGASVAPTSVEIRFAAEGDGTLITVTHRALTLETKSIWPKRVSVFTSGWDNVLPALKTFIEEA